MGKTGYSGKWREVSAELSILPSFDQCLTLFLIAYWFLASFYSTACNNLEAEKNCMWLPEHLALWKKSLEIKCTQAVR